MVPLNADEVENDGDVIVRSRPDNHKDNSVSESDDTNGAGLKQSTLGHIWRTNGR